MVELRDATPADAHAIANVLVQSWRAAYRGLLPDDVLAGLSIPDREQFWSDALTARPPHTRTAVATIAGAIVGFAATGPPLVPADRADPTLGDLYALYLDPTSGTAASAPSSTPPPSTASDPAASPTPACGSSTPTNAPCASTIATAGPIPDVPSSTEDPAAPSCTNDDSTAT